MIRRNAARCNVCGTTIESKHRHHFAQCPCGNIAVDGGTAYLRKMGFGLDHPESWTDLCEFDEGDA